MIAGQPVVPNSTQTLPCQPAKRVRMHVPMRPIYGCHRSSTTWHHRLRLQDRHRASRRHDHQVVLEKCCEGWASQGNTRHVPRASTCKRPQILCRTRACPVFCSFCCTRKPSSSLRTLAPACSNFTTHSTHLSYAIGRRRKREQPSARDCESARGCHRERTVVLIAARGEVAWHAWVLSCPLNRARSVSTDV